MSNQAFLVDAGTLDESAPGSLVDLTGDEGRHAVAVKRVRAGEEIDLVDGSGTRASCRVVSTGQSVLTAEVLAVGTEEPPAVRTVLVQALAKGDRDLQAVESAVEIGVDAVIPWQAERCVVRWSGEKAAKGRAKWAATVRAAVKQSRRAWAPGVSGAATTAQLASLLEQGPADDGGAGPRARLAIVLHEEADAPLAELVSHWVAGAPAGAKEVMLFVGPEGGIGDREVERLVSAGAVTASLGRNVLRASTAGPVGLVLVRHLVDAG
ncbi:16S rRNA (uracil(1498)-N(3))-methyltransferase [Zafaria sp. Z1313]|uniref:16S rRNA (uracil(1498)-N(3))-methyltransferase n=1 Tax=Zafaria sp. Z1313 TaxID=3423202 RepID=UPI003D302BBB